MGLTPQACAAEFQRRLDQCDAAGRPYPAAVVLPSRQYATLGGRWLRYDGARRVAVFGETPVYPARRAEFAPAGAVRWDLEAAACGSS